MRNQKDGELIQSYVADLRILARMCEYGSMKDEFIRDKIVYGIISDRVRKQLLKNRDLTLDKAVQICQLNKLSENYGRELSKYELREQDVNSIYKQNKPIRKQPAIVTCKNCGGDHKASKQECPVSGKFHGCGKLNHFKRVYYSARPRITSQKKDGRQTGTFKEKTQNQVNQEAKLKIDTDLQERQRSICGWYSIARAYIEEEPGKESMYGFEAMSVNFISPTRMEELRKTTNTDPEMQKLVQVIRNGWPTKYRDVPQEIASYFPVRDELLVDNGLIQKSQRVVVPACLRQVYIEQLHRGHHGV